MTYWITFNYGRDIIGAKIDGLNVTRFWNNHQLPDITLGKEYPYSEVKNLHPMDIQQGVMLTAGMEVANISNLRIIPGNMEWEDVKNG